MATNKYVTGRPIPSRNPALRPSYDSTVLYNELSVNLWSPNITVLKKPVLIKAFGLVPGEELEIYNVFGEGKGEILEVFYLRGEQQKLTYDDNTVLLPLNGRYRLKFNALLGDLVCTAYEVEITSENEIYGRYFTAPNAKQLMKPNAYFDANSVSQYSQNANITDVPWVFRAFGLAEDTEIEVYNVYGANEGNLLERLRFNGDPVSITADSNTLVLDLSGRYRFRYTGTPGAILLVGNPNPILYTDPYQTEGPPGPPGPVAGNVVLPVGEAISSYRVVRSVDGVLFNVDTSILQDGLQVVGVSVQSTATIGAEIEVRTVGVIEEAGWAWDDGLVFCAPNGQLTQTPSATGWLLQVGRVLTPTSIDVDLEPIIGR